MEHDIYFTWQPVEIIKALEYPKSKSVERENENIIRRNNFHLIRRHSNNTFWNGTDRSEEDDANDESGIQHNESIDENLNDRDRKKTNDQVLFV